MTKPLYFIDKNKLSSVDTLRVADTVSGKSKSQLLSAFYPGEIKYKWDSVSGPYNLPVNLTLPYNDNYLQFHFARNNHWPD